MKKDIINIHLWNKLTNVYTHMFINNNYSYYTIINMHINYIHNHIADYRLWPCRAVITYWVEGND